MSFKEQKDEFPLGPELYGVCSAKLARKRSNVKSERKWEWTLTHKDIPWTATCPVLGTELLWESPYDRRHPQSPTFVRKDPTKGYVPGNIVVMSFQAYSLLRLGTLEDFQKVVSFLQQQT